MLQRHRDAYRAKVRSEIEQRIAREREQIEAEELVRALNGQGFSDPLHATDPVRHNMARPMRHGKGTWVRVNQTFIGCPATPGTNFERLWKAAVQHLGDGELPRVQLRAELAVLLGVEPHTLSSSLTRLLDLGVLVARRSALSEARAHAVGEAWRHEGGKHGT